MLVFSSFLPTYRTRGGKLCFTINDTLLINEVNTVSVEAVGSSR